jgi:hypothetical protein
MLLYEHAHIPALFFPRHHLPRLPHEFLPRILTPVLINRSRTHHLRLICPPTALVVLLPAPAHMTTIAVAQTAGSLG